MIFLVQTPHPWRGIRQRPHHLMTHFAAAGHAVHWVEPRYLRWLAQGRWRDFWRARREAPLPNLNVRPVTLVNGERLAPVRAHNKHWLSHALRAGVAAAHAQNSAGPRILWLYNPHEAHLADTVPHDVLIYDIMDEYRGFPWSPPRVAEEEAALLRRADWVFAGTSALYDAKRPLAEGRIECILSGVDTEHFARGAAHGAAREAERGLEDAAHRAWRGRWVRVAGYAGMVDLRIDQGALREAARRLPHWGFVLLGPVAGDLAALRGIDNIWLAGPRAYEDLPAYYHAWDAALIPFVENELTRHINPTKILEYGAAEVPIVTRALPEVRRHYADGAWLYDSPEAFIAALEAIDRARSGAASEQLTQRLDAARAWAAERSWPALAERMLARVSGLTRMDKKN